MFSRSLACALTLVSPAAAQLSPFAEDFESLDAQAPDALSSAGWQVSGNIYDPNGSFLYGYGPFPAPNGAAFCQVGVGLGGAAQGQQQQLVFSDYASPEHLLGNRVESSVYQEQVIGAADAGKTFVFTFDARRDDLAPPSTAKAFIKVVDPTTLATVSYRFIDMSALPTSWENYSLELRLGFTSTSDLLLFGFVCTSSSFGPSGIVYDNLRLAEAPPSVGEAGGLTSRAGWELPEIPPAAPEGNGCAAGTPTFQGPSSLHHLDLEQSVLLHSGEFHWSETDLELPGVREQGLKWVRTYRSRLGRDTVMGRGWDHSYNVYVAPMERGGGPGMALWDGTGYMHRMRPAASTPGVFSESGFAATLQEETSGYWTVLFANGGSWSLRPLDGSPAEGKLERIIDRNGNEVALDYDQAGRLDSLVDTMGRRTTVQYDAQGRVASVTGPAGRRFQYSYHAAGDPGGGEGDLAAVTSPAVTGTPNGNNFPLGKTTAYTYSKGLIADELNHNLLTITNGEGETFLRNVYGTGNRPASRDRLLRQFLGGGADVTDYRYVRVPPARSLSGEVLTAVVNDRMGNVSHHSFDARNRLVREERFTGRAQPQQWSSPLVNRPGQSLRLTDPDSYVTVHSYNLDDRVVRTVEPGGSVIERVHEFDLDPTVDPRARGNVREVRRIAGKLGGAQTVLVDEYEYAPGFSACCGVDFVVRHMDPAGFTTFHEYDSAGNRIRTIHPIQGVEEEWTYDSRGRVVTHLHAPTPPQARRLDTFEYFPDQGGAEAGRIRQTVVDANGLQLATSYAYDLYGHRSVEIDPSGAVWTTVYNALGQPVQWLSPEATPGSGDRGERLFTFDAADRLVETESRWEGSEDPATRWVRAEFDYDSLGRLLGQVRTEGGTILEERRFTYDANGQLASKWTVLAGGTQAQVSTHQYDERGLPWRHTLAPGSSVETVTELAYSRNRELVRETVEAGGTVWKDRSIAVDGFGRPVSERDNLSGTESVHQYDPRGLETLHEVIGELVVDADPLSDRVVLSRTTSVHDALGRLIETERLHADTSTGLPVGDGAAVTRTLWSGKSLLRGIVDDLGGAQFIEYDTAHRKVAYVNQRGDRSEKVLDSRGNAVRIVQIHTPDLGGQPEVLVHEAEFDGRSRRVSLVDPVGSRSRWRYDTLDRPVEFIDARDNREITVFDGLGRVLRTEEVLTDTGTGNGVEQARIVVSRVYDRAGRLITSTDANGNTTTLGYDGLDHLVSRVLADGSAMGWAYQGPALVGTLDANGTSVASEYYKGRLASRTVQQAGPGVSVSDEQFTWDGLDRLASATDNDSVVEFRRDTMGNVVEESLTIGTGAGAITGVTRREHDGLGGLIGLTYPSGRSLGYEVRHAGPQAQVLRIVEAGQQLARFSYLGERVQQREVGADQGPTVRSTFDHDPRGWLAGEQHSFGAQGPPLAALAHQFDAVGNHVAYADIVLQRSHAMSFDSADRLVRSDRDRAGGVDEIQDYLLDLQGNRELVVGGPEAGAYLMDPAAPPADRQVNQYTETPWDRREYSSTGNLVGISTNGGPQASNTYDQRGRAVSLGRSARFLRHDALGRLIQEAVDQGTGTTTFSYFYLGEALIEERVGLDQPEVRTWVRTDGGAPLSLQVAGAPPVTLLSSPAVGVLAAVGPNGQVLERYDYGNHGTVLDALSGARMEASGVGNRYFFRSLRHDLAAEEVLLNDLRIDTRTGRAINRASRVPVGPGGSIFLGGDGQLKVVMPTLGKDCPLAATAGKLKDSAGGSIFLGGDGQLKVVMPTLGKDCPLAAAAGKLKDSGRGASVGVTQAPAPNRGSIGDDAHGGSEAKRFASTFIYDPRPELTGGNGDCDEAQSWNNPNSREANENCVDLCYAIQEQELQVNWLERLLGLEDWEKLDELKKAFRAAGCFNPTARDTGTGSNMFPPTMTEPSTY